MSVPKFGKLSEDPRRSTMNVPKSSAEILAAASQKKQKNSRPKRIEPFAGQMSTFSTVSDARKELPPSSENTSPSLDDVPTETGTSPLQFKPISTPLSFLPEGEVEEDELVNILFYVTCIPIFSGYMVLKWKRM
jgi:hypothetical protein